MDFPRKSCSRTETPEAPRARSITTARARRTAKGADFRRTNALAINTGTPHRMAALRTISPFPAVQTKGGSGWSLIPALVPGGAKPHRASQSTEDTPHGLPPHRLSLVVRLAGV